MAESRLVPTNLLQWGPVRDLLPDAKLLVFSIWANPLVGSLGVAPAGILEWVSGCTNITGNALEDALREFTRRGIVVWDEATLELYACGWFRFHKFGGRIRGGLHREFRKIQSEKIRKAVLSEIERDQPDLLPVVLGEPEPGPGGPPTGDGPKGPPSPPPAPSAGGAKKRPKVVAGVEVWDAEDEAAVAELLLAHGEEVLVAAAARVVASGKKSLPSIIRRELAPRPAPTYWAQVEALKRAPPPGLTHLSKPNHKESRP